MKYRAILFDMDGTLVPMDMHEFTEGYFKLLAKRLMPLGVDPKSMVKAMWAGCEAMVRNDGSVSNADAFWVPFEQITGAPREKIEGITDSFYSGEFALAKQFTQENPLAREAVEAAKNAAEITALATNPLFPMPAQEMRMSWVGLCKDDFALVTDYNTDHFCKPNPAYYISVCERLNVKPEECLMIGNDEGEDMYPASKLGMDCYLVTDTMIASEKHPWTGKRGTFAELTEFLKSLGGCE